MQEMAQSIHRLNELGYSNRAIARELGISRESVNKTVRRIGAVSPFAKPERVPPPPGKKERTCRRGDVLMEFWGGMDDFVVPLRAVVVRQFKHFTHCRVEAFQDGEWHYVYDQCFE